MNGSMFKLADIVLYIIPILLLYIFGKSINRHFQNQEIRIKLADLMVPYLMMGIQILSIQVFEISIFPYYLIILFSLGMIIAIFLAYKKGEIIYNRFFRTYWRFVFIFSLFTYYFLVGASILNNLMIF
ncbi:Protein of unknown function [Carnobacterium iners]|uniref:DUF3397 domain-containing protein n=1 Tax=Carnobacterium iners TaxID=1073423 RepID=A0A1X7NNS4_9LACT|nr:DUF3397 domain-containing protein [Carnobacterium iners]SEK30263.1 Protein of unknown function [Carnobacterium iners]SMH39640.1 Protein of unknown function [Carnobacterium iners]